MDGLALLKKSLQQDRPGEWENIPDLELYMDQVIGYMPRQHIGLSGDETLTSAMVNNYVKKGLLPRANGKKYGREHLAYLTAICLLKQVLSVDEVGQFLEVQLKEQSIKEFYGTYRQMLDQSLNQRAEALGEELSAEELSNLILQLAVESYTRKLVCQQLLQILDDKRGSEKKTSEKKTVEKK